MRTPLAYLCVALGSALGGVARFWLAEYFLRRAGEGFPWGTLFVNVTGSFMIGFCAMALDTVHLQARLFLLVGLCGGYTTFSSFSWQTLLLLRAGAVTPALLNVLSSVLLCVGAAWMGAWAGQTLAR